MRAYYNEIDPYAAQWLRNLIAAGLIADGDVDERSIVDVRADDVRGYTQCHFFAGIGGWSIALRLAGWSDDRPVWSGSCPCQRFSSAARGRNIADDLWSAWLPLIAANPSHPIAPGGQPPFPSQGPGFPTNPIVLPPYEQGGPPVTIWPLPGHPAHPIVIPPPPATPPEGGKPPPEGESGWGYHPDYGWGYFPSGTPGPKKA